jgi:Tetracyclin repressor-like, C-terminal domain
VHPELRGIVEDFEQLWAVAGFAEHFAANLALPPAPAVPGDPYAQVLEEHHRRLVAALRRAQQRDQAAPGRDLDELADALVGFYLSRWLCRRRLDDWAPTAIATIIY